ncbi:MAG TPA: AGE family epimerase/isomerase, partial [Microlunatus sp.]|nr:AGE family epimerase/isomerase [Microlunatus sp.]
HRQPDGTFVELRPLTPGTAGDTVVDRHRVPGHAVEGIWMAFAAMDLIGDHRHRDDLLASIPALCAAAWDLEHGGLLRYADASGPVRPTGRNTGTPYEDLVLRTWDTKLWWVHSETAVTTMIAAERYGHAASREWLLRVWDYLITTFPGGDEGEEWIQIRDRAGRPLDQVVGLPVKDPFHVTRNLMQLVELR